MDKKVTDTHLAEIAKFLLKWKVVTMRLGLEGQMVRDIEDRYRDGEGQRLEALMKWVEKDGPQATYRKIYDVMRDMEEGEAAEQVKELTKEWWWFAVRSKFKRWVGIPYRGNWLVENVDFPYCGRLYCDDASFERTFHFVITKDLPIFKDLVAETIQCKAAADMRIEFSEPHVLLELPKGIIGDGWKLVPFAEPTKIMKMEVDEFGEGKRLPRVSFYAKWTRADLKPMQHVEIVKLCGTKTPCPIVVECCTGVVMDEDAHHHTPDAPPPPPDAPPPPPDAHPPPPDAHPPPPDAHPPPPDAHPPPGAHPTPIGAHPTPPGHSHPFNEGPSSSGIQQKDPSKVLQENYSTLVDSIQDADTLADRLYAKDVIAGNVREKVEGCRTAKEKNRALIAAVQQQVGANPKSFQTFIDVLKMDRSNESVVSLLAVSSSGQALPSSKEVKATMSTLASKPLPQQSGDHSNVRRRHIERVISPASPTKPKKTPVACDWPFWITFLLLVLAFVAAFFAWNHSSLPPMAGSQ